jgi:hypothetical protein
VYKNGSRGWSERLPNVDLPPVSVAVYHEIEVG